MKKLRTIIQYECAIVFKYIWYFYAIQYAAVTLIYLIIAMSTDSFDKGGRNALEVNTLIYVGILGVMGFKEDFKMLIQNGFTRKYIFLATVSMFMFTSGIMALIDTVVGNILHYVDDDYSSMFGGIYGYDNVFANWIWLFLIYVSVCCLLYLGVLVINRIGKTLSIYIGIILGCSVLVIVAVFKYILSDETVISILETSIKAMGFMSDGTISFAYPVLTLLLIAGILGLGSYGVIRRSELK